MDYVFFQHCLSILRCFLVEMKKTKCILRVFREKKKITSLLDGPYSQPKHRLLKRNPSWLLFWDFKFQNSRLRQNEMFKRPEIQESQTPRHGQNDDSSMIPKARIGKRNDQTYGDNFY